MRGGAITLILMMLLLTGVPGHAADGPAGKAPGNIYFGGHGGISRMEPTDLDASGGGPVELDLDYGYGFGAFIGYDFRGPLRLELELGYQENAFDPQIGQDSEIGASFLLVNGYYDFNAGGALQPYLGAGIGFARVNIDGVLFGAPADDDDSVFAYQVGTGVGWLLNDWFILTANYRFLGTTDPKIIAGTNVVSASFQSHQFTVGARVRFP